MSNWDLTGEDLSDIASGERSTHCKKIFTGQRKGMNRRAEKEAVWRCGYGMQTGAGRRMSEVGIWKQGSKCSTILSSLDTESQQEQRYGQLKPHKTMDKLKSKPSSDVLGSQPKCAPWVG